MTKLNKNQQEFVLLRDRYRKACAELDLRPDNFYYEGGYVKCNGKKSKRMSTFETLVQGLEDQIKTHKRKKVKPQPPKKTVEATNTATPPAKVGLLQKLMFWKR